MDKDNFIKNSGTNKIFTEWAFKFPELVSLLQYIYKTAQQGYAHITGNIHHTHIHFQEIGDIDKKKFYEFISLANFKIKTTKSTYYKLFKKSTIEISWIDSKTNLGHELYNLIKIDLEELETIYQVCLRKLIEQNQNLLGEMPQITYKLEFTQKRPHKGLTYRQKQIIDFLNSKGLNAHLSYDLFANPILIIELNLRK